MDYPKRFANLPVATWPRLRGLLDAVQSGGDPINMTIGDPQHPMPAFLGGCHGRADFGLWRLSE